MEKKLAREQRRLSRKQIGSANYQKQKIKVARIHNRIANARSYSMHNLTRQLVDGNGIIVSRDMSVSRMLQNRDSKKKLPKGVKRRINRALLDAGFSEINRQLAYKAEWGGRTFVLVDGDYPTTQVCSTCGYKHKVLIKDFQSTWTCPECHAVHDRKYNAAENVLQAGVDILNERESSYVSIETSKMRKSREAKKEKKEK